MADYKRIFIIVMDSLGIGPMEDAAQYADEIIVMHQGTVYKSGTPIDIFSQPEQLIEIGLDVPETVRFQLLLQKETGIRFGQPCLSIDTLAKEIAALTNRGSSV